jgi:hypothetical protein
MKYAHFTIFVLCKCPVSLIICYAIIMLQFYLYIIVFFSFPEFLYMLLFICFY